VKRSPCRQRHRFLEPIHNVKEGANPQVRGRSREDLVFIPGKIEERPSFALRATAGSLCRSTRLACQPKPRSGVGWWSQPGSNRRPQACKASALPTELWPLLRSPDGELRRACPLSPCEAGLPAVAAKQRRLVGRGGVEPPTSRLSGVRSNHLSYRPRLRRRLRRASPISRQAARPPKLPNSGGGKFPG
jgi:hypothetical protein